MWISSAALSAAAADGMGDLHEVALWDSKKQGQFVMALAEDRGHALWVGTERSGVWRRAGNEWTQFDSAHGLAEDSVYALACDLQGRMWIGHAHHGVSVYNGETWKNYPPLAGPLGERVYAIAVSPRDGDVWIGTNAGLTRYSAKADTWSTRTTFDGLPSNDILAIRVMPSGALLVGTACDGLAMSTASSDFSKWTAIRMDREPKPTPRGSGLPSNLINDVLVSADGSVWAATTTGLAFSTDSGASWRYVRGADWSEKSRMAGAAGPGSGDAESAPLLEDYVTCLAEDGSGHICVGHRQQPLEVIEGGRMKRIQTIRSEEDGATKADDYVRSILATRTRIYVGHYGTGLHAYEQPGGQKEISGTALSQPSLPTALTDRAPASSTLKKLLARIDHAPAPRSATVVPLIDDWTTRGDWLGRYGREWAALAAMTSPVTYFWGSRGGLMDCAYVVGPKRLAGIPSDYPEEVLRAWIHWMYTDNPNSLEMPLPMLRYKMAQHMTNGHQRRRQAEWDDHGEAYPMAFDGPDIICRLQVPPGTWVMSLYDFNKDGHEGFNRYRDYVVRIQDGSRREADPAGTTVLCTTRIRDFDNGVYKRFLVTGPARLAIVVKRNFSFNTLLGGVFLDTLDEYPVAYERVSPTPEGASGLSRALSDGEALDWRMQRLAKEDPALWAMARETVYAAILASSADSPSLASTCAFHLHQFDRWESLRRSLGLPTGRTIELSLAASGDADGNGQEPRALDQAHAAQHTVEQ